jgi:hypothetical protein
VQLAGELLTLLAGQFPQRLVHGVGDAAYHGKPLLVAATTWTTRLPASAALHDLAPPPTGRRGRPALKGERLGTIAAPAKNAVWQTVTAERHGRVESVRIAEIACIWCGSFGSTPGRLVLVKDTGSARACDLALFTSGSDAAAAQIVERYAVRWSIEPSNAAGKQQMVSARPVTGSRTR